MMSFNSKISRNERKEQRENEFYKDSENLPYQLFLSSIEGIGARTIAKLLKRFPGGAKEIWETAETQIKVCVELSDKQKGAFLMAKRKWNPDIIMQTIAEKKINVVTLEHADYPDKLRSIPDPPYLLYYYGELPVKTLPSVAIIGARMCSDYGRKMAEEFAGGLAREGVQIISGLASGIDGIAQRAAVAENGNSYGILGCGVDYCYPASNRNLYESLKENGGLISEFPPGEKPLADHFPRRNRIISGLADIVLVIEAKERSGTSITVQMALEQGREVFAIPGRNVDELSKGCNRLIREGAGIALEINDIMASLSLMGYPMVSDKRVNGKLVTAFGQGQEVMKTRDSGTCSKDSLCESKETANSYIIAENRKTNMCCNSDKLPTQGQDKVQVNRKQASDLKVRICQHLQENNYTEQQLYDTLLKEMQSVDFENMVMDSADMQDVDYIYMEKDSDNIQNNNYKNKSYKNMPWDSNDIQNTSFAGITFDIQELKCIVAELELDDCIINRGGVLSWKY